MSVTKSDDGMDGIQAGMAYYKPLTPAEEQECYKQWRKTRDCEYRNKVLYGVYPLIVRLTIPFRGQGIDDGDLVNEAVMVALEAFEKWRPSKARFSTYIGRPIRWKLTNYMAKHCPIFARKHNELILKRQDPDKMQAKHFSLISGKNQEEILSLIHDTSQAPDEEGENVDMLIYLHHAFMSLGPRDQNIVARRIDDEGFRSIGEDFGVSQEGARQIYLRAAQKMRVHLQQQLMEEVA